MAQRPNIFVRILRFLWTGVNGLRKILHLVLLLMIFSVVISVLSPDTPKLPKKAALVVAPVEGVTTSVFTPRYVRCVAPKVRMMGHPRNGGPTGS